jgi:hypothetical protein
LFNLLRSGLVQRSPSPAATSVASQEITKEAGLVDGDVKKPSSMLIQNLN